MNKNNNRKSVVQTAAFLPDVTSDAPQNSGRGRRPKATTSQQANQQAPPKTSPTKKPPAPKKADLEKQVGELRNQVSDLGKKVATLEQIIRDLTADKAKPPPKPTVNQQLEAVNQANNDAHERERRSKNAMLHGIEPTQSPEDDAKAVKEFLAAVKLEPAFKSCQRQHKADGTASLSIRIVFDNRENAQRAIKAARSHNLAEYKGVFAHEDRTKAQQKEFIDLRKTAKRKNDALDNEGLLDNPFRYVVRGAGISCIDAVKSRTSEPKRSIYVKEDHIVAEREKRKQRVLDQAVLPNGFVSINRGDRTSKRASTKAASGPAELASSAIADPTANLVAPSASASA